MTQASATDDEWPMSGVEAWGLIVRTAGKDIERLLTQGKGPVFVYVRDVEGEVSHETHPLFDKAVDTVMEGIEAYLILMGEVSEGFLRDIREAVEKHPSAVVSLLYLGEAGAFFFDIAESFTVERRLLPPITAPGGIA